MERKRFWKPSSIPSDSPPTAAVTSPDRFSAATAPAAVSVGQRLLTSGGKSRAGALAAARRLIIPLGSFLPPRRVGRAVFDHRRVLPGPGLRARWGRRGLDLAGPLLHLPPDALQRRRDPFRQGITTLRCLLSHLRLYRALPEEEVHRHLAPASAFGYLQPPRVVALHLGPPLHAPPTLVHGQVALRVEGAPASGVLQRRPDSLARGPVGRWTLYRSADHGGQVLGEVVHVR